MLDLINWLALAVAIVTSVLVPIFIVGWSFFLIHDCERPVLTLIKTIVSLLFWLPFAYVAIYVFLAVGLHGGAVTTPGPPGRTLQGTILMFGSSLVYVAIGYVLVALVRGKSGTGKASASTSGGDVNRRPDVDLKKQPR
jgi:hypothetical protein